METVGNSMHTPYIQYVFTNIIIYIYNTHIYKSVQTGREKERKNCAPPTYILLKYIVIIYYNYTRNIHDKELKEHHKLKETKYVKFKSRRSK